MLLQVLVIIESDAASVPWQERLDQQQEVKKEDGTVQMTSAEVGLLAFLHPAAPAASSAFHVLSDATLHHDLKACCLLHLCCTVMGCLLFVAGVVTIGGC